MQESTNHWAGLLEVQCRQSLAKFLRPLLVRHTEKEREFRGLYARDIGSTPGNREGDDFRRRLFLHERYSRQYYPSEFFQSRKGWQA